MRDKTNKKRTPVIISKNHNFNEEKSEQQNSSGGFIPFNIPLRGKDPAQIIVPENVKKYRFRLYYKFYKSYETTVRLNVGDC